MNKKDLARPLAPLDPETTAPFGEPVLLTVAADGRLDAQIRAWQIGHGELAGGDERATEVLIFLTTSGFLLTERRTKRRTPKGWESVNFKSQFHETPAGALAWLFEDGSGKLGPASKTAWSQACETFGPMFGMQFDPFDSREIVVRWRDSAGRPIPLTGDILCGQCGRIFEIADLVIVDEKPGTATGPSYMFVVNHIDGHRTIAAHTGRDLLTLALECGGMAGIRRRS